MNTNKIYAFSLAVADIGYRNQILAAFHAINELTGTNQPIETAFILPLDVKNYTDVKKPINFAQYKSYAAFKNDIFKMLDAYFARIDFIPQIFITSYNQSESLKAGENTDMLCRAIKEYYKTHQLGFVFTSVVTSKPHDYKYVDFINVPKHILTFASRIRLLQNKKLRKKVLITVGTINNFTKKNMLAKFEELQQKLEDLKDDVDLKEHLDKFQRYILKPKKVVFCLGGRVEGNEIIFDIDYAQKLFSDAQRLTKYNYGIVFVNGPRTPSQVSDYLFEQAQKSPDIIFHNSKRLALSDEEKTPENWRLYFGRHEPEFKIHQKLGNIYPGILGFDNTLVVHSMDTYSSCETANAAIPTAISYRGLYVDPNIRYDCHNLYKLLCPKYAIDWDDFLNLACNMNMGPQDFNPLILSNPLRVYAETLINKLSQSKKNQYGK